MDKIKILFFGILEGFGILWLTVEIISFFSVNFSNTIKNYWLTFLILGVLFGLFRLKPRNKYSFKINNRDIKIELVIGDLFKQDGALIIGSNTKFVTAKNIISKDSIQGIFCEKYFKNNIEAVDAQIDTQIKVKPAKFGETAIIKSSRGAAYFCVIADINEAGIAKSNLENLRIALSELWFFLSHNAEKSMLNTAILGSGFSRISTKREDLIKEIVKSFIAATSQGTFCDGLRIVVHPSDLKNWSINIDDIVKFIEYSCNYSIALPITSGSGNVE